MARVAGSRRFLAVPLVARQATDPFVHAEAGAIVAAARLHAGHRCVALIAERLAMVRTHPDGAIAFLDGGQRQPRDGHVGLRPAVEKRERWPADLARQVLY